ncbi:MAG: recombination protein RecR [Legionellaceae bacterium]|nr:recombination protein RecR [Legionellaceae bacterium]
MDAMTRLATALRCLPGVGPKSAQRMVYHLLQQQRSRGLHLADCLRQAMECVSPCQLCNNFTEGAYCSICSDTRRDVRLLCVVESAADILAIEQSQAFHGRYFVLNGKISPLDGLGPEEIALPKLAQYAQETGVTEVIVALSASVEAQATLHFIEQFLAPVGVKITQLAHGIPSGGELEYLDGHTISSALKNRALLHA